ncbi:MAG: (d)CMP kinase, partial [Bacteroidota bacterium]
VMDGRDIGTVVFPQAELKIFLTAKMPVRVQRRMRELLRKGNQVDAATVETDLKRRDHRDSTRENSPLRMAEDGIEIDTSNYTIEQQSDLVVEYAQKLMVETA